MTTRSGEQLHLSGLERLATAVSLALVLGLVAVIVRDALTPDVEATLSAHVGALRVRSGAHHLSVRVRNDGDRAAQGVAVHVELLRGDSAVAEGEATVDWLPGRSERQTVMVFRDDPRAYTVRAEVRGYADP